MVYFPFLLIGLTIVLLLAFGMIQPDDGPIKLATHMNRRSKTGGAKLNPERMAASRFLRNANAIHAPTTITSGKSGYAQMTRIKVTTAGLVPESAAIPDRPARKAQIKREPNAINCETISQIKVPMRRLGRTVRSVIKNARQWVEKHCLGFAEAHLMHAEMGLCLCLVPLETQIHRLPPVSHQTVVKSSIARYRVYSQL
jgi:hypothetical protein